MYKMLRFANLATRNIRPLLFQCCNAARIIPTDYKCYSAVSKTYQIAPSLRTPNGLLINNKQILDISNNLIPIQNRTVTKFSLKKGKRKTVKAAIKRFFRLHWGGWIRTKVGRKKHLWKKSSSQKRRLRQHVICNATQSKLLDKMVTKFWKRPKYYVDDPYEPYHTREEFPITRKKPVDAD